MAGRTTFIVLLTGVCAAGAAAVAVLLWPAATVPPPPLAEVPSLPALSRTSTIMAPVTITMSALRDAMEAAAPRNLSGKRNGNIGKVLRNADIGWTIARGPLALSATADALVVGAPLNGTLRVTGQLGDQVGNLTGALGGLLGPQLAEQARKLGGKTVDQRVDFRGTVTITARPALTPAWRIEPNLTPQVGLGDAAVTIVGVKLNVGNEVKPMLDRSVAEQMATVQARLRNNPAFELAARREWAKLCRSLPLRGNALNLWLEMRPLRAYAAQPRIGADDVTFFVGVEAETRVVPMETKPECPFPAKLDIRPSIDRGRVAIAVPIDVPFTELNRLLAARLIGRTFSQGQGSYEATVKGATVAASGDRLLISLQMQAREKSFFGFGGDAVVYVWGRPVLDLDQQILRLTDLTFDVQSETAFGLLGAAARAALPQLTPMIAEHAVIDLKPFASDARKLAETMVGDFRKGGDGVRVETNITDLRLVAIAFDERTLRVTAEANGTVKVTVTAFPPQ